MPSLGADMTEGSLLEWLVHPGDRVHRGDLVAVVKTDKADVEVEVFDDGVIGALLVPEGDEMLPIGTPLATIVTDAPAAPAAAPHAAAPPAAVPPAAPAPAGGPRVAASPLARRRAAELGIDLAHLPPPRDGRPLGVADVEQAARRPPVAPDRSAMRRTIGALMARSKREIPHYYLTEDIELSHTLAWLARYNADVPLTDRVLRAAVLYKAVARAARDHPAMNGYWRDDAFVPADGVHLGIAIALRGGGLVAPAIRDVDRLALGELMSRLRDLTARVRGGRLRGSEMTDATLTVTSLGDQGVGAVYGVIHPPQVALVGFGRIGDRVWDAGGGIGIRPVVTATLAADHRASDGLAGARFLSAIARRLHEPEEL
jgi:pyruvate dehydrogenase E2 component (dihydrolipoamide acetyltransferase)